MDDSVHHYWLRRKLKILVLRQNLYGNRISYRGEYAVKKKPTIRQMKPRIKTKLPLPLLRTVTPRTTANVPNTSGIRMRLMIEKTYPKITSLPTVASFLGGYDEREPKGGVGVCENCCCCGVISAPQFGQNETLSAINFPHLGQKGVIDT